MLDLLPVYDGRLRVERRFSMKQSEIQKRLREYILRSHLQESSESVLIRSMKWFCELHGDIAVADVGPGSRRNDSTTFGGHSLPSGIGTDSN